MTPLAGGFLVINYHDAGARFQKVTWTKAENKGDHYVKQLLTLGMGDHENFLFVSFLLDKTIEKSIPFSSRERPKNQKRPPKLITWVLN